MLVCRPDSNTPRFDPNIMWTSEDGWQEAPLLVYAVRHRSAPTAAALLNGGAHPSSASDAADDDDAEMSALHWAVLRGDTELVALLLRAGADWEQEAEPWTQQLSGRQNLETPLLTAVMHRNWACIEALLKAGADINGLSNYDRSPLLVAICSGDFSLAERLIFCGADVDGQDDGEGYNIFCLLDEEGSEVPPYTVDTLLEAACYTKSPAPMVALLLRAGAVPTAATDGWGPLAAACKRALQDVVALLLEHILPTGQLAAMGWQCALQEAAGAWSSAIRQQQDAPACAILGLLLDAGRQAGLLASLDAKTAAGLHEAVHGCLAADMQLADRGGQLSREAAQQATARAQLLTSYGLLCQSDASVCLLVKLAGSPPDKRWSTVLHRHHPPALKAAARLLLLASHRGPAKRRKRRRSMWHLLPRDLLLQVLAMAGSDIKAWAAVS
ncbi:hypothetical protein ABPG75_004231 [Micractinium tetrahymenae]